MDIYGNPQSCYKSTADCLPKAQASTLESCQLSFDSKEPYTFLDRSIKPSAGNRGRGLVSAYSKWEIQ